MSLGVYMIDTIHVKTWYSTIYLADIYEQLFSGCMDPAVAPNDALVAVKGPMMLQQNRRMFAMQWFKDHCWTDTVRACLKVTEYVNIATQSIVHIAWNIIEVGFEQFS